MRCSGRFLHARKMSKPEAIDEFLNEQHDEASPSSVANLMHDLIGSVPYPENLSTSKEYM
jgi:hypothetical protein